MSVFETNYETLPTMSILSKAHVNLYRISLINILPSLTLIHIGNGSRILSAILSICGSGSVRYIIYNKFEYY